MGTKYEVWAWNRAMTGYMYKQTWGGQHFLAALIEARKARRAGAGCVRIEWR